MITLMSSLVLFDSRNRSYALFSFFSHKTKERKRAGVMPEILDAWTSDRGRMLG
jgi:hypothetical protein